MAKRRAARVDGSKGITSSSKNPLDKLPSYKRAYVQARVGGKTIKASSAEAGVKPCSGTRYEKEADVQKAYRFLMQKAISAQKLVNLVKGGCEAKMPIFDSNGKKKGERADWKTRRPYIEMAAEHAGYHESKKESGNSVPAITFVVQNIGQPKDAKVIDGGNQRITQITAEAD